MWPKRQVRRREIETSLRHYSQAVRELPGIIDPRAIDTLSMQLVASIRREDYFRIIQGKRISPERADPARVSFDAERAVVYHKQQGNIDEAAWLIFLIVHFGKPASSGWLRLRDVYGMLEEGVWTWEEVVAEPAAFGRWLAENWRAIRGTFGNHRKYESLNPAARRNMTNVVRSYVDWIGPKGHESFIGNSIRRLGNDPTVIFNQLYQEMSVLSFGRLGKFDYLSMLGRYNIAPIFAGSAYLEGATGPASGARLLFNEVQHGPRQTRELQRLLNDLDQYLQVGMQVFEDALCNWQKSPLHFVHFRG